MATYQVSGRFAHPNMGRKKNEFPILVIPNRANRMVGEFNHVRPIGKVGRFIRDPAPGVSPARRWLFLPNLHPTSVNPQRRAGMRMAL